MSANASEVPGCSEGTPPPTAGASTSTSEPSSTQFECNICLDTAKDAVISYCGHLFWLVHSYDCFIVDF